MLRDPAGNENAAGVQTRSEVLDASYIIILSPPKVHCNS